MFAAAGVYNIGWGLTTALYPQWLYRLTGGATHDRAEMASALGLVVGLYGVLYLDVARGPERGALIAALRPFPEARAAVVRELLRLEASDG